VLLRAVLDREDDFLVVGEARDGYECLDVVTASLPDLLLLDLEMPVMDGLEALALLSARMSRETVVVMLCDQLSIDAERDALRLGAAAMMQKPVGFGELLAVLRTTLRDHGSA
jgi:DNA-binding response OmpR family regulator